MRKLTFLLLLLPFVALGITACDGSENPAGPAAPDQASLAGTGAGGAGPISAAGHGRELVPYRAEASFWPGTANMTPCFPDGSTTPVAALPAFSVGEGEHSHLGRATSVITDDYCTAILDGPTLVGLLAGGTFTHTAANGDAISGVWDALFTPPSFEFVANGKNHPIVVTDGTGRFAGASGYAYGSGTIDPNTGQGSFSVQGVLTSVGSLK
jgi:hypothetical protein